MALSQSGQQKAKFGDKAFFAIAALLAFGTYFFVFRLSGGGSVRDDALASLRNFLPLAVLTLAVRPVILRYVRPLNATPQLAAHLTLAMVFSFLWYWLLMVMIGLSGGRGLTEFRVQPFFDDPAFSWQLLQGAMVYTTITALTFMRATEREAASIAAAQASDIFERGDRADSPVRTERGNLQRYLIRRGEDILPVEVDSIISIEGADDYAEVISLSGRHLLRCTLKKLEESLDGGRFVRVHRSRIVNMNRLVRAEPAGGGRLILHMESGEAVHTSRSGAKAILDRTM
jgi:two-component system, LytTR family, response regulator